MQARGYTRTIRAGGRATRLMTAWLHVHRLIRSVNVEDVDDAAWPEVKDVIRQAVDRRTRSSRERWWNLTRPPPRAIQQVLSPARSLRLL